ncbi:MAG: hypothetical protein KIS86_08560 [Devosia sp.]|nr:hypothetical protein [Devosia sp.]
MSARIAPRIDTIRIGFSPQHPKKHPRQHRRPGKPPDDKPPPHPTAADLVVNETQVAEALPPETLFEAALLNNNRPLTPYEIAQRLSRQWVSPSSSFPLTDKTI